MRVNGRTVGGRGTRFPILDKKIDYKTIANALCALRITFDDRACSGWYINLVAPSIYEFEQESRRVYMHRTRTVGYTFK